MVVICRVGVLCAKSSMQTLLSSIGRAICTCGRPVVRDALSLDGRKASACGLGCWDDLIHAAM
eukprot:7377239-Prymnesium_polylepis.5